MCNDTSGYGINTSNQCSACPLALGHLDDVVLGGMELAASEIVGSQIRNIDSVDEAQRTDGTHGDELRDTERGDLVVTLVPQVID